MTKTKTKLPSGSSMAGHAIGFSIMRLCGVSPIDAVDGNAAWPEDYAPDYVENDRGTLRMRVTLDKHGAVRLTINGDEASIFARGQSLPESARMGLEGQPVSVVVDHVLFTGSNLTIAKIEASDPFEDGEGLHFSLSADPKTFTAP